MKRAYDNFEMLEEQQSQQFQNVGQSRPQSAVVNKSYNAKQRPMSGKR